MKRLADWLLWSEGSSRTVALVRIGFVALAWDRLAEDLLLYKMKDGWEILVAASFYVATPLLLVGLWTRVAAVVTAASLVGVFVLFGVFRHVDAYTHHHVFLLVATSILLALTPCGRSFSVDRWLSLRRADGRGGPAPAERGPLFGQRLLAMQVSAVYLWAAYDKLIPAFLSGERLQHILLDRYGSSDPPTLPGFEVLCQIGAVATVAIEGALAVGLWIPRVQRPLMALGLLFHGMLFVTLPVGPFSATMALLYLAFLDPAAVHRATVRLVGGPAEPGHATSAA